MEDDVHVVEFHMGPHKAPNPDGYGACFYHDHWSVVGKDVCHTFYLF